MFRSVMRLMDAPQRPSAATSRPAWKFIKGLVESSFGEGLKIAAVLTPQCYLDMVCDAHISSHAMRAQQNSLRDQGVHSDQRDERGFAAMELLQLNSPLLPRMENQHSEFFICFGVDNSLIAHINGRCMNLDAAGIRDDVVEYINMLHCFSDCVVGDTDVQEEHRISGLQVGCLLLLINAMKTMHDTLDVRIAAVKWIQSVQPDDWCSSQRDTVFHTNQSPQLLTLLCQRYLPFEIVESIIDHTRNIDAPLPQTFRREHWIQQQQNGWNEQLSHSIISLCHASLSSFSHEPVMYQNTDYSGHTREIQFEQLLPIQICVLFGDIYLLNRLLTQSTKKHELLQQYPQLHLWAVRSTHRSSRVQSSHMHEILKLLLKSNVHSFTKPHLVKNISTCYYDPYLVSLKCNDKESSTLQQLYQQHDTQIQGRPVWLYALQGDVAKPTFHTLAEMLQTDMTELRFDSVSEQNFFQKSSLLLATQRKRRELQRFISILNRPCETLTCGSPLERQLVVLVKTNNIESHDLRELLEQSFLHFDGTPQRPEALQSVVVQCSNVQLKTVCYYSQTSCKTIEICQGVLSRALYLSTSQGHTLSGQHHQAIAEEPLVSCTSIAVRGSSSKDEHTFWSSILEKQQLGAFPQDYLAQQRLQKWFRPNLYSSLSASQLHELLRHSHPNWPLLQTVLEGGIEMQWCSATRKECRTQLMDQSCGNGQYMQHKVMQWFTSQNTLHNINTNTVDNIQTSGNSTHQDKNTIINTNNNQSISQEESNKSNKRKCSCTFAEVYAGDYCSYCIHVSSSLQLYSKKRVKSNFINWKPARKGSPCVHCYGT